jgi:hypothetical protein
MIQKEGRGKNPVPDEEDKGNEPDVKARTGQYKRRYGDLSTPDARKITWVPLSKEIQDTVLKIAKVLGVEQVNIEVSFFDDLPYMVCIKLSLLSPNAFGKGHSGLLKIWGRFSNSNLDWRLGGKCRIKTGPDTTIEIDDMQVWEYKGAKPPSLLGCSDSWQRSIEEAVKPIAPARTSFLQRVTGLLNPIKSLLNRIIGYIKEGGAPQGRLSDDDPD